MPPIKLVISRYNENLDWANQFSNVLIYNKGNNVTISHNIITLPNVGREGHTIFHHIYENYDCLDEYTAFLQGNPFDHSPNLISNLTKYISSECIPDFQYLSENYYDTYVFDCPHHSCLPMRIVYNKVFGCNMLENKKMSFASGAQFIVSKRRILQRPREFYKNIIEILEYSVKPVEGWVIERLQNEIFKPFGGETAESDGAFSLKNRDEVGDLNQRRIKSAPAYLTSSGSMTDKEMNAAPEGRFQIFSGLNVKMCNIEELRKGEPDTEIPIIIVCYNNYKYVKNTIDQLIRLNPGYKKSIIIMNNSSDDIETIEYLNSLDIRIKTLPNKGPWVTPIDNADFYNELPDKFIISDPDLEFHPNLPTDFVNKMSELSDKYKTSKIGFSINMSDSDKMYPGEYIRSVIEWESKFWQNRISDDNYELYSADIDTTFSLINKKYWLNSSIRIAGNFTCRHLPFYINNGVMSLKEEYDYYLRSKYSSLGKVFLSYFNDNYKMNGNGDIQKNNNNTILSFLD
jgi:Protein of unknown function (DUF3431)/Glycosyl transferase family 2